MTAPILLHDLYVYMRASHGFVARADKGQRVRVLHGSRASVDTKLKSDRPFGNPTQLIKMFSLRCDCCKRRLYNIYYCRRAIFVYTTPRCCFSGGRGQTNWSCVEHSNKFRKSIRFPTLPLLPRIVKQRSAIIMRSSHRNVFVMYCFFLAR